MFAVYRATLTDGEQNRESAKQRLQMPVLAIGGRHYIGEAVHRQMEQVADNARGVLLIGGTTSRTSARTSSRPCCTSSSPSRSS